MKLRLIHIITLPVLFRITGLAINDLATNFYYNILFFLPSGLFVKLEKVVHDKSISQSVIIKRIERGDNQYITDTIFHFMRLKKENGELLEQYLGKIEIIFQRKSFNDWQVLDIIVGPITRSLTNH